MNYFLRIFMAAIGSCGNFPLAGGPAQAGTDPNAERIFTLLRREAIKTVKDLLLSGKTVRFTVDESSHTIHIAKKEEVSGSGFDVGSILTREYLELDEAEQYIFPITSPEKRKANIDEQVSKLFFSQFNGKKISDVTAS